MVNKKYKTYVVIRAYKYADYRELWRTDVKSIKKKHTASSRFQQLIYRNIIVRFRSCTFLKRFFIGSRTPVYHFVAIKKYGFITRGRQQYLFDNYMKYIHEIITL